MRCPLSPTWFRCAMAFVWRPTCICRPLRARSRSSWNARPMAALTPAAAKFTAANRTPASRADIAAYFTAHGYAVVYQDTRGRYGSEGRFGKYLSDREGGFESFE